jgi:hypothetical protein
MRAARVAVAVAQVRPCGACGDPATLFGWVGVRSCGSSPLATADAREGIAVWAAWVWCRAS